MTRAITLHNVSKAYGRSPRAVDRLSLSIDPGEFVVLLGPSGCGKSTVLRMIAGLEDTSEGEILLDGEPANHLTPRERGMAMVFQNFALYPTMTNRANIGFPLKLENPRADHNERIENTARMLGIERVLDRLPGQLSGGERQRVAMGRAISRQPSAFLMDEPLSNLDAKLRNHLRAEIAQLTKELGVTTVYVTHDQAEAMSLGHRVAVMRGGVLQQVSPPREVYALPENVFVAAFIGTPRINLLQAVVHAPLEGRMSIDLGRQRLPLPEPLSPDHQLLRIQQGRPIIVGLRSEAVRIAPPSHARPGEVALSGIVEHVEYQGHEALVHLNTGSRPAVVPELESARTDRGPVRRRRGGQGGTGMLDRIRERAGSYVGGNVAVLDAPEADDLPPGMHSPDRPAVTASDLVVRTGPDMMLRTGGQVPLLVDLAHLYVFDHQGRRICPLPKDVPGLDM
ncbi:MULTISPECIES: ABC transporter ATP-binding protein [unclassified Streptomyces]|uniref:ABC transporter ATP-binding protein n=1 Tax=unclassified Streptomyces TaxID=2593676 RepID=UPI0003675A51|nr:MULTISPECIES: ABC transporter ATP-binding protein [unclassified Streptomyces]MYQ76972.1 ATP-binding cassette domain-containing protein [Streptomyces sp. SID4923]MYW07621.1 ATP-binding cassette domain-containing protein [Streptomyces sp. SID2563]NEC05813.1 ABC transporter ATP-binding protein [Streptomyces sp. SID7909]OKI99021.1 sugar ABC transporter ATP-binding protein [Streptomyces sp. CB01249]